jgi:hypothetical protein
MQTYENLLANCVRYIQLHGTSQQTIDKLEDFLPGAWSAELIADALDIVASDESAKV